MTDYYAFRKFVVKGHGHEIIVVGKAGVWSWSELNPGTAALLDVAQIGPADRVLDLGCGTGVIGAVASNLAPQGHVTLVDCNVAAVACAKRTMAANGISNAEVRLVDGATGLPPASFDVVLSHLPRGRAVQQAFIQSMAWGLRPGGRLYFVGHRQSGIKGTIAHAREVFGRCGVIRQKKGYHVAMTIKPVDHQAPPPTDGYTTHTIAVDDVESTLVSKPGVFAWNHLDEGTAALIDTMEIATSDCILDLGCGTGLAGLAAARRAPDGQVVLVDADVRAVESARRTLEANGVTNSEVMLSDCGSAVFDRQFDVAITNPPFHQDVGVDYEVARQFVRDAERILHQSQSGRLFLVANRFLRYDELVQKLFGNVTVAYADNRYYVLKAVA